MVEAQYVVWVAAEDGGGAIGIAIKAENAEEAALQIPDDQTVLGVGYGNQIPQSVQDYFVWYADGG